MHCSSLFLVRSLSISSVLIPTRTREHANSSILRASRAETCICSRNQECPDNINTYFQVINKKNRSGAYLPANPPHETEQSGRSFEWNTGLCVFGFCYMTRDVSPVCYSAGYNWFESSSNILVIVEAPEEVEIH